MLGDAGRLSDGPKYMGYTHNLLLTDKDDPRTLLSNPSANSTCYREDVGFWSDTLVALFALTSKRDLDANFDELSDEVTNTHAENKNGPDFVTIIPRSVSDSFAELLETNIEKLADNWANIEEELTWHETLSPPQMLLILIEASRIARQTGRFVAIYSFE